MQPKYGLCPECNDGINKPLIAGLCASRHYWAHRRDVASKKKETREERFIAYGGLKLVSESMVPWYAKIMASEAPVCWECGSKINKFDRVTWHGSIAHVIPKSLFDSVKTHPMNYLILGRYCCHGIYDSSWDAASKMKIWPVAVERFRMFEKLIISPEEYRKLPLQLCPVENS